MAAPRNMSWAQAAAGAEVRRAAPQRGLEPSEDQLKHLLNFVVLLEKVVLLLTLDHQVPVNCEKMETKFTLDLILGK